ncbi:GNAT family N-acetyltransferase [Afipia carboxidovorans]|uniref:GNAT family N-acetyltransferase n=1 Tax=Afipia carboxidovorans TaxID=40137 RepID=UPI00308A41E2|nr:GNAT family N-acetyltransferase [Afipia carboxidovorans]
MAMAAEHDYPSASAGVGNGGAIAHVRLYQSFAEAEVIWRGMETRDHFYTPFQRFDFLNVWQIHTGPFEHTTPLIVVALDADNRPLMLMPLATVRDNGVHVARFLGGKHSTFNMPIWRRDFAARATKADLNLVFQSVAAHGIDLLALTQQPKEWHGNANPFAQLPGQPSANACPLLQVRPGATREEVISSGMRYRIRQKERKLSALPGYRYFVARTDEDITRALDYFFATKPLRMAAQNLPNVFAAPHIEAFVRAACLTEIAGGYRAIDVHAIECRDEILAMFGGVADGHRYSMMFNTYTMSENARHSPGMVLLRNVIDHDVARGFTGFDLGIGAAGYKLHFCKGEQQIFDCFIPFTARGRLAALGMSSLNHAKRIVKQNPTLVSMANRLRAAIHR